MKPLDYGIVRSALTSLTLVVAVLATGQPAWAHAEGEICDSDHDLCDEGLQCISPPLTSMGTCRPPVASAPLAVETLRVPTRPSLDRSGLKVFSRGDFSLARWFARPPVDPCEYSPNYSESGVLRNPTISVHRMSPSELDASLLTTEPVSWHTPYVWHDDNRYEFVYSLVDETDGPADFSRLPMAYGQDAQSNPFMVLVDENSQPVNSVELGRDDALAFRAQGWNENQRAFAAIGLTRLLISFTYDIRAPRCPSELSFMATASVSLPSGSQIYVTTKYVTALVDTPTAMATAPGDSERLFVTDLVGRVRIIKNGQMVSEPFLDITTIVNSDPPERGLVGLALHLGLYYSGWTINTGLTASIAVVVCLPIPLLFREPAPAPGSVPERDHVLETSST